MADRSAWWALLGAVALYLMAGSPNAVGVYSERLKEEVGIGQEALSAITSFGFVGYLAPFGGAICDRWGIRAGVATSGGLMALGYLVMYLSTCGVLEKSALVVGLGFAVALQGMYWLLVAGAVLFTANFPLSSGVAGGIVECALGLSAGIWTVASTVLPSRPGIPLLLVMSLAAALATVGATAAARIRPTGATESRGFTWLRGALLGITAVLVASSDERLPREAIAAAVVGFLAACCATPLLTAHDPSGPSAATEVGDTMRELTLGQALCCGDFWCALAGICVPIGVYYAFLQTMGQVVAAAMEASAAEEVQRETDAVLALGSVAAGVAALVSGAAADRGIERGIPRPAWFAVSAVLMAAGSFAMAQGALRAIYAGFFLGSLGLSVATSIFPSTVYELFGKTHNGKIFGVFNTTFSVIQLVLNMAVAVPVYEAHASGPACYGASCYAATFYFYAALSLATLAPTAMVTRNATDFYARMYASELSAALLHGGETPRGESPRKFVRKGSVHSFHSSHTQESR